MVGLGAEGSDADFEVMLTYLVKNFGPEAPRPVNVNKASAVELESGLSLTRTESAALVRYRTEKDAFKAMDDLKNVRGWISRRSRRGRPGSRSKGWVEYGQGASSRACKFNCDWHSGRFALAAHL